MDLRPFKKEINIFSGRLSSLLEELQGDALTGANIPEDATPHEKYQIQAANAYRKACIAGHLYGLSARLRSEGDKQSKDARRTYHKSIYDTSEKDIRSVLETQPDRIMAIFVTPDVMGENHYYMEMLYKYNPEKHSLEPPARLPIYTSYKGRYDPLGRHYSIVGNPVKYNLVTKDWEICFALTGSIVGIVPADTEKP